MFACLPPSTGLPDIGQLFPDNDPQWSGSDSSIFMEEVRFLRHKRVQRCQLCVDLHSQANAGRCVSIVLVMPSTHFLQAYSRMTARGYEIGNVDVTLILQRPKVRDLKPQMADNIARLLRTPRDRVNVKARTHEDVDSVGEGRAMETHVVLTLMLKDQQSNAA